LTKGQIHEALTGVAQIRSSCMKLCVRWSTNPIVRYAKRLTHPGKTGCSS